MTTDATRDQALDRFWEVARQHADLAGVPVYTGENPVGLLRPPAWAFGGTPQQADRLLALVLDGTKTATASARADYDAESEELPDHRTARPGPPAVGERTGAGEVDDPRHHSFVPPAHDDHGRPDRQTWRHVATGRRHPQLRRPAQPSGGVGPGHEP